MTEGGVRRERGAAALRDRSERTEPGGCILVIDGTSSPRDRLAGILDANGFEVTLAPDGGKGREALRAQRFDLLLVDLENPGIGGLEALREIRDAGHPLPAIVTVGRGSGGTDAEAMRRDALGSVAKPFDPDVLLVTVRRALDLSRLRRENAVLRRQIRDRYAFRAMIGTSRAMEELHRLVAKVAETDGTILVAGESGTGKQRIARTIHHGGPRGDGPFMTVPCAAIPAAQIEAELFGHERGAMAGVVGMRPGRFEQAAGGTVFLDEIGGIPLSLQPRLLRVIRERTFERIGGTRAIRADIRIIASTSRDLEKARREGTFRQDLYDRLHVIPLRVPPLRERADDIPLLVAHFAGEFCRRAGKSPVRFRPEAIAALSAYPWPGNVRELENAVWRLVLLNETGTVAPEELPDPIRRNAAADSRGGCPPSGADGESFPIPWGREGIDLYGVVDALERKLIRRALDLSGGVKNRAAALLGLNRTTLVEKIKKKGIAL